MGRYLEWNEALARHFFKRERAGKKVLLHVTPELLEKVASDIGDAPGGFIEAVKEGPPWVSTTGLCQRAYEAMNGWKGRGLCWPPYIAYLGLFALAWTVEGGFAPHAYYPRLRKLLGSPGDKLPGFEKMWELWEDLEEWAVHDRKGALGVFRARSIGGHFHIGYPLAQVIIPPEDLERLPMVFGQAGLDPSFSTRDELQVALQSCRSLLSSRTKRILGGKLGDDALESLIDLAEEELREWDGEPPAQSWDEFAAQPGLPTSLHLCLLELDLVARLARAVIRCRLGAWLPETGVSLELPCGRVATATWEGNGWSSPLELEDGNYFDAGLIDWGAELEARERSFGWTFRLPRRPARVFASGTPWGLPGLVEVPSLPLGEEAIIAVPGHLRDALASWGRKACVRFEGPVEIQGLPLGWTLGVVGEVKDLSGLPTWLKHLKPEATRIRLAGGIRATRKGVFFSFAPPRIRLEGKLAGIQVYCNGQPVAGPRDGGLYDLPSSALQPGARLVIEARRGSDLVACKTILLQESFEWRASGHLHPGLAGGYCFAARSGHGSAYRPLDTRWRELALEDLAGPEAVLLLGQAPGHVTRWSRGKPLPPWEPAWAVFPGRRPRVVFCGVDPGMAIPVPSPAGCRWHIRAWKEVIWHWRKRVSVPRDPVLQSLWRRYEQVARKVHPRRPAPVCAVCNGSGHLAGVHEAG